MTYVDLLSPAACWILSSIKLRIEQCLMNDIFQLHATKMGDSLPLFKLCQIILQKLAAFYTASVIATAYMLCISLTSSCQIGQIFKFVLRIDIYELAYKLQKYSLENLPNRRHWT